MKIGRLGICKNLARLSRFRARHRFGGGGYANSAARKSSHARADATLARFRQSARWYDLSSAGSLSGSREPRCCADSWSDKNPAKSRVAVSRKPIRLSAHLPICFPTFPKERTTNQPQSRHSTCRCRRSGARVRQAIQNDNPRWGFVVLAKPRP